MADEKFSIEQIKTLVIIAMVSDDFLMEKLVLKGGNAIALLQRLAPGRLTRTSYDLDFSIEEDFDNDLEDIKHRIKAAIQDTFAGRELVVFDYAFSHKPKVIKDDLKDFWGGYYIEFKIISLKEFNRHAGDVHKIRSHSVPIKTDRSPKVEIEISKYEYVAEKIEMTVDGHRMYMYSPQMIVFEKIRAICQQHPGYNKIILSHQPRARARDFYDIHLITEQHSIRTDTDSSRELIKNIFEAKKVPLSFVGEIKEYADIHRGDWQNVIDTLPAGERNELQPFEFYLDFVVELCRPLTSL